MKFAFRIVLFSALCALLTIESNRLLMMGSIQLTSRMEFMHNPPAADKTTVETPCTSAESLTNFLQAHDASSSTSRFSKHNPICPTAARNHIHIVIPFYNLNDTTINNAVQSAAQQEYPTNRFTIWIWDDASNQPIHTACSNVYDFPIPSSNTENWFHAYEYVNEIGLSSRPKPHVLCFRSSEHLGPGGSKYWLLGLVRTMAEPNDVVLILDGDDELSHTQALQIINQKYIDTAAWFTYGSYKGRWDHEVRDLDPTIRNKTREFNPRNNTWVYGHPRTFKAHLLDHISYKDLTYSDGSWLLKGTDCGIVYRLLELSGPDRIAHIPTQIYQYNYSPTTSTMATISADIRIAQIQHIKNLEPAKPLILPLHVVLLVWKRVYLLKDQLIWLQNQRGLNNRPIHLHVINNNWMAKLAVEKRIESFKLWQFKNGEKLKKKPMLKVTVIHNPGKSHHNFARFVYVDQLRHETPLDHVIFLDDDQYWFPTFLSTLLKEHKPKGMTTWYGKTFKRDTDDLGKYWKPVHSLLDIVGREIGTNSSTFKYGGTGGSILDTNLWLLESQLQRLAKDLSCWSKIDDLWSSYVLDALLGWEIRRLQSFVLPIDIGAFRVKGAYHDILSRQISVSTEQQLMKLHLPKKRNILKVATYTDPTVDKEDMFKTLQTTFAWDIDEREDTIA